MSLIDTSWVAGMVEDVPNAPKYDADPLLDLLTKLSGDEVLEPSASPQVVLEEPVPDTSSELGNFAPTGGMT